jgi:hypothetical protein
MPHADTICNGCGRRVPTSKEHLLHVAVAQVLLRDRRIKTGEERDAALRGHPFFKELRLYRNPLAGEPERRIYLDVYVENLICKHCNSTWARVLEEEGGSALYQFIHLHRPAKTYCAYGVSTSRSRCGGRIVAPKLCDGATLVPVMRAIRDRSGLDTSIRVARVAGSHWQFASTGGRWVGDPPHIVFIIWVSYSS